MRLPMLFSFGLAALVLLLAPVAAPAQSPIPPPIIDPNAPEPVLLDYRPWQSFSLPTVGVAIDLPAEPKRETGEMYSVQGTGFLISVSSSNGGDWTPEQLRKMAEISDTGYGNRILSVESFVQAGVAGVETRLVTPQGQLMSHSTYSYRTRLYQVIFIIGKGGSLSPYAERLRTSLRFLGAD